MTTGRINQVASVNDTAHRASVPHPLMGSQTSTKARVIQGNQPKVKGHHGDTHPCSSHGPHPREQ